MKPRYVYALWLDMGEYEAPHLLGLFETLGSAREARKAAGIREGFDKVEIEPIELNKLLPS
jgi:hypothetical protein